jgi:hypothetical protein
VRVEIHHFYLWTLREEGEEKDRRRRIEEEEG